MTATLKRLSYARICIEICIDDSLPNILELEQEDGSIVEIRIEYNWVPKKCSICCEFGHLPKNCKKGSRQSWVPKSSAVEAPPPGTNSGSVIGTAKSLASKDNCLRSSSIPAAGSSGSSVSLYQSSAGDAPSIMINPGVAVLEGPASLSATDSARLPVSKEACFPCSAEDPTAVAEDPADAVDDPNVSRLGDPSSADDPLGSGVGDPIAADDPFREDVGDPLAVDDPFGTGADDPIVFDDPIVPMSSSSVPPVGDSAMSPTSMGCEASSPSSSSSFSCTPLIARRVKLVDELEKKQGKQMKHKKKNRNAGNSKGKISLKLDD